MSRISFPLFPLVVISLLAPVAAAAQNAPASAPAGRDWPTWGYDAERTGWNKGETTLNKSNVSKLKLLWGTKVSTPVEDVVLSTLTAPIVVEGVSTPQGSKNLVLILGADDTLFALDADSGAVIWQKTYSNPVKAPRAADWLCPNTANDTPTVDKEKGIVYFIPSDGKLRGISLADGSDRLTPTDMVAPFSRSFSLNLFDNVVYVTSGRACGQVLDKSSAMAAASTPFRGRPGSNFPPPVVMSEPSSVTAMDVSDLAHPQMTRFYTNGSRPATPWGRGGGARGPGNTLILETSDGQYDPASGDFSESILKLMPKATRLADSFTPDNHDYIQHHDLAGSASPTVFTFGGKTIVAVAQKEGVLRLLDANALGGGRTEHSTPLFKSAQLGNDLAAGTDPSQGIWGAVTTYESPEGKRFVYVPMWGPTSKDAPAFPVRNGDITNGSVMAFQVTADGDKISAVPQWISSDLIMPDPPVVANGVLYAVSTGGQAFQNMTSRGGPRIDHEVGKHFRATPIGNLTLYAYDAQTGKQLYSSKKAVADWVHFGEPVVALGKVFLETHDGHVYAFGLKR